MHEMELSYTILDNSILFRQEKTFLPFPCFPSWHQVVIEIEIEIENGETEKGNEKSRMAKCRIKYSFGSLLFIFWIFSRRKRFPKHTVKKETNNEYDTYPTNLAPWPAKNTPLYKISINDVKVTLVIQKEVFTTSLSLQSIPHPHPSALSFPQTSAQRPALPPHSN